MTIWTAISEHIETVIGRTFVCKTTQTIGGGCINSAAKISDGQQIYFVKLNQAARREMFEAEAAGLAELAASQTIRVPKPLTVGCSGAQSFIVMDYIALGGRTDEAAAGRQLAALHRTTRSDYGWERDNTIGATPQFNTLDSNWCDFFCKQRLAAQLQLAAANGYGGRLQRSGEQLLGALSALLDHHPPASLLHGDLWGGNLGYDASGAPVIFDPAVYYGDRETDLAMTELFGGFGARFYAAYREAWPLDAGYKTRKSLYNLYHILNHLNLFGGGYLLQAERMIEQLLAHTR